MSERIEQSYDMLQKSCYREWTSMDGYVKR